MNVKVKVRAKKTYNINTTSGTVVRLNSVTFFPSLCCTYWKPIICLGRMTDAILWCQGRRNCSNTPAAICDTRGVELRSAISGGVVMCIISVCVCVNSIYFLHLNLICISYYCPLKVLHMYQAISELCRVPFCDYFLQNIV